MGQVAVFLIVMYCTRKDGWCGGRRIRPQRDWCFATSSCRARRKQRCTGEFVEKSSAPRGFRILEFALLMCCKRMILNVKMSPAILKEAGRTECVISPP